MVSKSDVMDALREVYDPEIPINVVDLGLIYDVRAEGDKVHIKMTMTAPGCPLHSLIARRVKQRVEALEGVTGAEVEVVWEPRWTPVMMSSEAKKKLGLA